MKIPSTSNGWRSKFAKRNNAGIDVIERDGSLQESFTFINQSKTPLGKDEISFDPYLGLSQKNKKAAWEILGTSDARRDPSHGKDKLDRLRVDVADAHKLAPFHSTSNRSTSDGNIVAISRSSSSQHINTEETTCPVCLELLSFRLAGEKPHITPICGHALHHACFTAVYGPPEAVMAAQSTKGRGQSAPGMCGVCRNLIVLGEESEGRRSDSECICFSFDLLFRSPFIRPILLKRS